MPLLKNLQQHKILIDTHVWLWIVVGHECITEKFSSILEVALIDRRVLISPLSIWEIGMLVEKNRIELNSDTQDWVDKALNEPGLNLAPLTPEIAVQSSRLPGEIHGDPVDRMLIATAYENNAVLVTCDSKILDFGKGKFISVYNPTKRK